MAKFSSSQGKFVWDSGSAINHIEENDFLLPDKVIDLRDKMDYFANTCTNVYSNLESCFAEKINDYGTRNNTDRETVNNTVYNYNENNENDYRNTTEKSDRNTTEALSNRNNRYYGNYSPRDRLYYRSYQGADQRAWCMGGHNTNNSYRNELRNAALHVSVLSGQYITVNSNEAEEITRCLSQNSSQHNTYGDSVYASDNSNEYGNYNSSFDDQ